MAMTNDRHPQGNQGCSFSLGHENPKHSSNQTKGTVTRLLADKASRGIRIHHCLSRTRRWATQIQAPNHGSLPVRSTSKRKFTG